MTRPSTTRRGRVAALAVAALLALTACAGGAGQESASSADQEVAASGGTSADAASTSLQQRHVERKGWLTLTTRDVARTRDDVLDAVASLDGYVADERSRTGDDGDLARTTLRLVVPTASFDEAMEGFAGTGRVASRRQSAVDVTEQVVDVDSRVASAQASIARIRALLERAQAIGDVVKLESELSTRQAELESLQAQQASLRARTDTATIRVSVRPVGTAGGTDLGFLTGLGAGWTALGSAWTGLATAAGALLPFLVALGVPTAAAFVAVRRHRRRRPTPA